MMSKQFLKFILVIICVCIVSCRGKTEVSVADRPDTKNKNDFYISNRAPLLPSPFIKLPIGSIRPKGWVRKQLELQMEGFVGHLAEISRFLEKKDNAWLSTKGEGHSPWEELPYWLRGFGDTGYVLGDERIIEEARIWLEAAIASQREDGYFGPHANLKSVNNKPDLWPNMIMLFALQSYYEYNGDGRVLDLMSKYFKWEMTIPDEDFLTSYWQHQRAADNLFSVYWLYNITGEEFLLELADKIHRNTADWTSDIADWHNVNISQAFGGPTTYYMQSKDSKHLEASERNYQKIKDMYGQVPGGMFGGDENCRPGCIGPRQAIETCGMVEMMLSHETLLRITGDAKWADRCEEVAFNSLPAALTADHKALRYLTAPNMVLSDRHNKSPGLQNGGPMLLMNPHYYRCCQHNVGHGWPYYAENLWLATPGNGLAAVFYADCAVTAKVGNGKEVTIEEKTKYPFEDKIEFVVSLRKKVRFPLYLRVPGWCKNPKVEVNGKQLEVEAQPCSYILLERKWRDGDRVHLELPMEIEMKVWTKNKNSISINRGPITYSLKIGEQYVREGGTDEWPAWEIHPTTPWNYGLVLDEDEPLESFEIVEKGWPSSNQPFAADAVPIELNVAAKKIVEWKMDYLGLVGEIQQSPAVSNELKETVTLIPMGAARLRISALPVIGIGPEAHRWQEPAVPGPPLPTTASYYNPGDTTDALSDGLLPKSSNDHSIVRFTWWDHKGTKEWVQYDFGKKREFSGTKVYWFDDSGTGDCRVPQSWRILYRDGDEWKPVIAAGAYGIEKDKFNSVEFEAVETAALRLEVQLQPNFSGGIFEWRVKEKGQIEF